MRRRGRSIGECGHLIELFHRDIEKDYLFLCTMILLKQTQTFLVLYIYLP